MTVVTCPHCGTSQTVIVKYSSPLGRGGEHTSVKSVPSDQQFMTQVCPNCANQFYSY
jgi:ribosomal protein S27E